MHQLVGLMVSNVVITAKLQLATGVSLKKLLVVLQRMHHLGALQLLCQPGSRLSAVASNRL